MAKVKNFSEITFTDEVKGLQEEDGSRQNYAKLETYEMNTELSEREVEFIQQRDSFYMASVNSHGEPYVQFKGGDVGFLKVLDAKGLAFFDYPGNRQYVSLGNINETRKVQLIFIDYPNRMRLKVWATAEVKEEAGNRAIRLSVRAFDWNCPKYIPRKYTLSEISKVLEIGELKDLKDLKLLLKESE